MIYRNLNKHFSVVKGMGNLEFSINWDYRCPFARIVNEHVVVGLKNGATWDVKFVPFSLTEVHTEEGDIPSWEDPRKASELLAVQVGMVVNRNFPNYFYDLHLLLFSLRHEQGRDLRDKKVLEGALSSLGLDPQLVFAEIESGWPLEDFRQQHDEAVKQYAIFGVPTFISEGKAAFVRLMERIGDDPQKSIEYIEKIVDQISNHSEINELKHTTISN